MKKYLHYIIVSFPIEQMNIEDPCLEANGLNSMSGQTSRNSGL
jgi:hypothetical protein